MKTAKRIIAVICVLLICVPVFTMAASAASSSYYPELGYGATGNEVRMIQTMLNRINNAGLDVDGIFGAKTRTAVRVFQQKYGLKVDGIVGDKTWPELIKRYKTTIMLSNGSTGNDVKMLQRMLNYVVGTRLSVDGIFGSGTRSAVIRFQKGATSNSADWDGIVGPKTWQWLFAFYFDAYYWEHN